MAQEICKPLAWTKVFFGDRTLDFQFEYVWENDWPPLAWIVECTESDPMLRVRHGSQVEIRDEWFCEAIWDGDFHAGDFDRTDLVFGSGVRLREHHVVFVSSGTTVDRLQSLKMGNRTFVSNSLACLLAVSNTQVDPTYGRYQAFFRSIERGIDSYERHLPTQDGILELVYFRNLQWDGRRLIEVDKPTPLRDFGSFAGYYGFLNTAMANIAGNMRATSRCHHYEMMGTLSSGYDSPTTSVLARQVGMERVFSFHTARGGLEDHGKKVAEILGLELTLLDRRDWQRQAYAEVPYFVATGEGEDVIFSAAKDLLQRRVLITGFQGGKVWGKDTKALGPDIVRGDVSGLSFTEHRLALGCIHFPVPFMGIRQIRDIHALSNSEELRQWDILGNYSRPICRRIVEEAGVPRELFGMRKKAATNLFHRGEAQITENTQAAYFGWLSDNRMRWRAGDGKKPIVPGRLLLILRSRFYLISRFLRAIGRFAPLKVRHCLIRKDTEMQRALTLRINMMQYLFPWAIERMSERYLTKTNGNSAQ
jgi:hypothetical protein